MKLLDFLTHYFDIYSGKYDSMLKLVKAEFVSDQELIYARNQFLTDLINSHARSNLISKYVCLNSRAFDRIIPLLFGDKLLVKEIIKVGSNLADYFGYCEFASDSTELEKGFSLVIDRNCLAFSPNDVHALSDLISKNIRYSKVEYVSTKYDPAYQLPTYSILGVKFNVVPGVTGKFPHIEF